MRRLSALLLLLAVSSGAAVAAETGDPTAGGGSDGALVAADTPAAPAPAAVQAVSTDIKAAHPPAAHPAPAAQAQRAAPAARPGPPKPGAPRPRLACLSTPQARGLIQLGKIIPLIAAVRSGRQAAHGEMIDGRLCAPGPDRYQYVLTFLSQEGRVRRVWVDAQNGAVVRTR